MGYGLRLARRWRQPQDTEQQGHNQEHGVVVAVGEQAHRAAQHIPAVAGVGSGGGDAQALALGDHL